MVNMAEPKVSSAILTIIRCFLLLSFYYPLYFYWSHKQVFETENQSLIYMNTSPIGNIYSR